MTQDATERKPAHSRENRPKNESVKAELAGKHAAAETGLTQTHLPEEGSVLKGKKEILATGYTEGIFYRSIDLGSWDRSKLSVFLKLDQCILCCTTPDAVPYALHNTAPFDSQFAV